MLPDGLLHLGRHLGASELAPLLAIAIQAGEHSLADDPPFLLPKHRRHLDHRPTHWRATVDPLLIAVQPHTGGIEFGEGIGDVEDAPTKPIDQPDQQDVEPRRTASLSI
jgi:hypothetical protein